MVSQALLKWTTLEMGGEQKIWKDMVIVNNWCRVWRRRKTRNLLPVASRGEHYTLDFCRSTG